MKEITKFKIKYEGEDADVLIREGIPEDIHFVTNSWVRSYRKNSRLMQDVPQQIYSSNQYQIIIKLLGRSSLYVACNPYDKNQIFGWVCFEPIVTPSEHCIHFTYVKSSFRNLGIGKKLISSAMGTNVTYFTHQTYFSEDRPEITHNPFLIIT